MRKYFLFYLLLISQLSFAAAEAVDKLFAAIECNLDWRVNDLVLQHPDLVKATSGGWTALHKASFYDRATMCKILLKHGANPNTSNRCGYTALHVAKSASTLSVLIDGGADINATLPCVPTPLLRAMFLTEYRKIDFLLERGARIDQTMLNYFETKFSYGDEHTTNYFRDAIVKKVLPFISKGDIDEEKQTVSASHHSLEERPSAENNKIECCVCMEELAGEALPTIPCKNPHPQTFLCNNCCTLIKAKDSRCPLCRENF